LKLEKIWIERSNWIAGFLTNLFMRSLVLLLVSSIVTGSALEAAAGYSMSESNHRQAWSVQGQSNNPQIYLPMIISDPKPAILTGIYPQGYPGDQKTIDNEFKAIDNWVGQKLSIGGTFINWEWPNPRVNFKGQMEVLWNNGYTPFVNLTTSRSAAEVANGAIDSAIEAMASAYVEYAQGNTRMAYLAPFPEMNGDWVSYKLDPENYKRAFVRIQTIFKRKGVPDGSVRWVFAPNGWSRPGTPDFEAYYPGDSLVDVVSFSAYNFAYNPYRPAGIWYDPPEVFGKYINRMRAMAPSKPIFVAQTATSAYTSSGESTDAKNRWLREAYQYLAESPGVRAVIYFNISKDPPVDWPFYLPGDPNKQYTGYRDGVLSSYTYLSPAELKDYNLVP
jgi:hypothetical protein